MQNIITATVIPTTMMQQNNLIRMTARCRQIYCEDYNVQNQIEILGKRFPNGIIDYKHNSLIVHYKKHFIFNEIHIQNIEE